MNHLNNNERRRKSNTIAAGGEIGSRRPSVRGTGEARASAQAEARRIGDALSQRDADVAAANEQLVDSAAKCTELERSVRELDGKLRARLVACEAGVTCQRAAKGD